jgi:pyruvate formate lyase activating enzyme
MTAEEEETEVAKDIVFYESSVEGGVTLSGGEPLAQGEFAVDILQRCRTRGIHTAIETCLYADPSILRAVEPLVDFFIADIKILDQETHRIATGVSNERILENFRILACLRRGRDDLLVRIPLIPGYTANDANIGAIARFVAGIDEAIPIELVNFNPLAESKFARMGEPYEFVGQTPFTQEAIASFEKIVARSGARVHKNKATER